MLKYAIRQLGYMVLTLIGVSFAVFVLNELAPGDVARKLLGAYATQEQVEHLTRELGLERLLLEGGGGSNGAFLRDGLIDEISLAICSAVDGAKGAPSIFDSSDKDAGIAAPIRSMTLASTEVLEGGVVRLRYRLQNR